MGVTAIAYRENVAEYTINTAVNCPEMLLILVSPSRATIFGSLQPTFLDLSSYQGQLQWECQNWRQVPRNLSYVSSAVRDCRKCRTCRAHIVEHRIRPYFGIDSFNRSCHVADGVEDMVEVMKIEASQMNLVEKQTTSGRNRFLGDTAFEIA